ncbi:MAG: hypothetical protein EOM24_07065 [Chloroflexia bacterium]|nr:hypothetical protein [Chloroflexia bacterium]
MDGLRNHKASVPDALMTALAGVDTNPGRPHVTLALALDPEKVDQLEVTGRANSALYQGFNQAIYNTSDDCGPRIDSISPVTLPRFTAWLQMRYANEIARLNAIWRTDFTAFEAIDTTTIRSAKETGRVELWMDYCLFINETYLNAQHRYQQAVQSVDPRPATGCDAIYYGHSLASLFRELGYIMPYYTPLAVEMGRSLAKSEPPLYTGICMGYGTHSPRPFHEYLPWHILFAGNNSILFWSLSAGFNGDLVAADTIRYRPGWMMGETGRIKLSGAGMFINASKRQSSGVAMLYSEGSKRAEDVDALFNKVEESALNFQELLFDQGLDCDYVSTDSIVKDNALADPSLKLLVLPHTQVITSDEAAHIRRFVERGGALLADIRPGIRDGHGRRGTVGMLDDVFGIRQTNTPAAKIAVTFPGQSEAISTQADPGVVAHGAVPRFQSAGIPLFLENRFGQGRTLLMNHEAAFLGVSPRGDAESATTAREAPPGAAAYDYFAERLATLGVAPTYRARLNGAPPLGVKLIGFSRGDTELLAVEVKLVGGLQYPANLELDLGESCHVVEIRSGRDYGQTSVLKLPVQPYDVMLFALLRQRPEPLVIEAPERMRAGETLRATVRRPGAPDASLLHFALARPDGVLLRDYQERVLTDGSEASCGLSLPLNAPPGQWQLTVTDWVTQKHVTVPVLVERSTQP